MVKRIHREATVLNFGNPGELEALERALA